MTGLFALLRKTGLSRILTVKRVESFLIRLLKHLRFGSAEFAIKVEGGHSREEQALYECSLSGEFEGRITGLVAAKVAERLALSSFPSGVFHIEQLFTPLEFLESLGHAGLKFEEKAYVTV